MSIKSFAYQLSLKSENAIKRSQCYELFAAAHGYKTYAAIDCVVAMPEYHLIQIDNELLLARSRGFGLDPDLVNAWLTEVIADHTLKPFTFIELAHHIEYQPISDIRPFVDAALPSAQNGNSMAHYCLALLYAGEDTDAPESDYWYRQRLSGKKLSEIENEYADEYQRFVDIAHLAKAHLNAAADLGNVSAMIKLALWDDDPRILDSQADLLNTEVCLPWGVGEIADYALSKGRHDEYRRWLTLGCALGEIDAITQLALDLAQEKPLAALALVKYAGLHGRDITKAQTRAVNERGDDYDDDVGGAVYVEEIEGVQIQNVMDSDKARADSLANEWFMQYQTTGKARISIEGIRL